MEVGAPKLMVARVETGRNYGGESCGEHGRGGIFDDGRRGEASWGDEHYFIAGGEIFRSNSNHIVLINVFCDILGCEVNESVGSEVFLR